MINFRHIEEQDIPVIQSWYDDYEGWEAPPLEFLPGEGYGGIVVHKEDTLIAAGYMYESNSKLCHVEWVIADKKYKEDDRNDAINMVLETLIKLAILQGYKAIFAVTLNEKLLLKYEGLGFKKNPTPSHELILKL